MKIERKLPANFRAQDIDYFRHQFEINLPPIGIRVTNNYWLLFTSGILVNCFKIEKQSLLYDSRLSDNGGKILLVKRFIKAILKNKIQFLRKHGEFITIINEWSQNYFHWFTEALPKLVVAIEEGLKPVVLLPEIYNSAFQIRSLELMNIEYRTFAGEVLIGKGIILPNRLAPYSAHYNPPVMMRMVALLKLSLAGDVNKGNRIYVSRRQATKRRIKNEETVIEVMKAFGFYILETEELSLDEQISIMHHADIFVSAHGAGLTNMIFCEAGTKIFELCLKNQILDKCYFNLANALELHYYYQFCESADSTDDYHTSDLVVDVQELKHNLFQLTNAHD
jgi:capsular polysaccharide biosynthesis protein